MPAVCHCNLRIRLLFSNKRRTSLNRVNNRLQLTHKTLQIIKLGLRFAAVVAMSIGSSVGSWRFTLGALCCLVTELAAEVPSAMKSGSGAKLHRSVTAVILLLKCNRHSNMMFALTTVVYVSRGKG